MTFLFAGNNLPILEKLFYVSDYNKLQIKTTSTLFNLLIMATTADSGLGLFELNILKLLACMPPLGL